jgi:nucleotide-binding universal stress UspA family protein
MPHHNLFKKILFCTDFNSDAMGAYHYALNIAEANSGSELVIFHVIPEPDAQFWKSYINDVEDVDNKARHDIDAKMAEAYLSKVPPGIICSTKIVTGNVGEQILKEAQSDEIDLIIIGRGAGKNMINRLLGDFIKQLIHKANCPVLVIPEAK